MHHVEHTVTRNGVQLGGVAARRVPEIGRGDVHQVGSNGDAIEQVGSEIAEVAVAIAVGGNPLVDLEDVHLFPGKRQLRQRGEHRRRRRTAAHREREAAAGGESRLDPHGDPLGRTHG